VTPEVKLAAAATGQAFALASPGWARPIPDGLVWHPLLGNPLIRRTWAAWHTQSRRRDLAHLVAELDLTAHQDHDTDHKKAATTPGTAAGSSIPLS
jgi:hypothetical protein